ncbi:nuclear transport factor 2 family protein [Oceanobacillus sp. CAU 1775]
MNKKINESYSLKERALSFLQLVTDGRIDEAYDTHIGSDFSHHNPYFPGDAASLKEGMKESQKQSPNKVWKVKHAIEDGQVVAVHSHLKQNANDLGVAVVHIFRFHENKIVEMWDLGQQIPEEIHNENGMF